ncbi:hypothetical protein [uncultured Aquimarina sp.]|uniref:hypothetical protein n=1 Tax=uncultured Aquimarina sp. TaxID=575652 RepID=UPI002602E7D0|nr:hypothetical protein [uncultured Aquimarina sp.]
MSWIKKIAIFTIVLIGIIVPFIPSFIVIEMFFLLIPFGIIFVVTLIYLIISLLSKNVNTRKALFVFSILPIFIISQIVSGFTVDKIQRLRSNRIITEIEKLKSETGVLPEKYELIAGIEYIKLKDNKHFIIKYSRGFMVTEKYDSENTNWRSYGWND